VKSKGVSRVLLVDSQNCAGSMVVNHVCARIAKTSLLGPLENALSTVLFESVRSPFAKRHHDVVASIVSSTEMRLGEGRLAMSYLWKWTMGVETKPVLMSSIENFSAVRLVASRACFIMKRKTTQMTLLAL